MDTIKSGLCQRISDGAIFNYCQNEIEKRMGYALLSMIDPKIVIELDGIRIVETLGLVDINYGFMMLS